MAMIMRRGGWRSDLETLERVFEFLDSPCHDHDVGTFLSKLTGDSLAHSIRAASDNHGLSRCSQQRGLKLEILETYPSLNGKCLLRGAAHFGEYVRDNATGNERKTQCDGRYMIWKKG